MDKIEVFGTEVKAGGKATISGSTEVSTVTEKNECYSIFVDRP